MKRILFALSMALCLIGCNKLGTDEITARYSFEVPDASTKAVVTSYQPLSFVCEAGDKIEIRVRVLDHEILSQSGGLLPSNYIKSEQKCYLVYDGAKWNLDNSGKAVQEIEVTGKEGDTVEINYDFTNEPEGDYKNWFSVAHTKAMPLKSGSQSVVLDLTEAESIAQ